MENRTFATPGAGTSGTAAAVLPEQGRTTPHAPGRTLRARRRRPAVLAMAVALIAAGGLGGAVLYNSTGQRVAVLALAHDVPYGQVLTDADLVVARIATDPALKPLDAADRSRAVGMRAATDLKRGEMLTKAHLAQSLTVQPGQLIVGVAAKRTQLPATRLQPGVPIVVVYTPDTGRPESLSAVVVAVGRVDTDGSQVIDVAVPSADAARLAAWVASQRIQVVLAPRGAAAGAPSGAPAASPSAGASGAAPGAASGAPAAPGGSTAAAPSGAGGA
ncbi:SAF domain-containing protein [Kitasatospora hibisci]|uniref:SAF domain-containing protein n=1 Tax=Kitasatospora hibisci TaxID=3369522 RepID=UPI003754918B